MVTVGTALWRQIRWSSLQKHLLSSLTSAQDQGPVHWWGGGGRSQGTLGPGLFSLLGDGGQAFPRVEFVFVFSFHVWNLTLGKLFVWWQSVSQGTDCPDRRITDLRP